MGRDESGGGGGGGGGEVGRVRGGRVREKLEVGEKAIGPFAGREVVRDTAGTAADGVEPVGLLGVRRWRYKSGSGGANAQESHSFHGWLSVWRTTKR